MPMLNRPIATPRFSRGKISKSSTMTSGWMTPAPNPWITRPTMIMSRDGETLLTTLPKMKTIKLAEKVAGCPNRAISQVFASKLVTVVARKALERNCALSWPTP
jgi:hypothetical protein